MATTSINLYLDENKKMFLNSQRTLLFPGLLYQRTDDPYSTVHYADEGLTIRVNLFEAGCSPESPSADTPTTLPMRKHDGFTKEHTLFLIDLMRIHLDRGGEGLPKSLKDLNSRLKFGRKNKKELWVDMASTLTEQYNEIFCPDKVARKWSTLVEGYKKVKTTSTGKGTMRFQFYKEMDDLLGNQRDVVFPVVGTKEGVDVRRRRAGVCSETATAPTSHTAARAPPSHTAAPASSPSSSPSSTPPQTPCTTPRRPRKRPRVDDLLAVLREAELASQRRHQEVMEQMRSTQRGFECLMKQLIEKI